MKPNILSLLFALVLGASLASPVPADAMGWLSDDMKEAVEESSANVAEGTSEGLEKSAPVVGAATTAATGNPIFGQLAAGLVAGAATFLAGWADRRRRKSETALDTVAKHADKRLSSGDKRGIQLESARKGVDNLIARSVDRVTVHGAEAE